jgi:hypothetical protein
MTNGVAGNDNIELNTRNDGRVVTQKFTVEKADCG